jgi:hypothetical protein
VYSLSRYNPPQLNIRISLGGTYLFDWLHEEKEKKRGREVGGEGDIYR